MTVATNIYYNFLDVYILDFPTVYQQAMENTWRVYIMLLKNNKRRTVYIHRYQ